MDFLLLTCHKRSQDFCSGGEVGCTLFWPPILTTFLVVSVLTIQNTHTPPKLNTAPSSTQ